VPVAIVCVRRLGAGWKTRPRNEAPRDLHPRVAR
jgi:hypothetical protein